MEPRVTIALLGGFEARLNGLLVEGFESDKARALLVYLTVENDGAHRREKLAGLFWPELPEKKARHNLSQTLYNLRHILGDQHNSRNQVDSDPLFIVNRQTIQLSFDRNIRTD